MATCNFKQLWCVSLLAPERGSVRQQFEGQGRGNVVRDVSDAEVEERQVHLHEVAVDDLQVTGVRGALHPALKLENLQE